MSKLLHVEASPRKTASHSIRAAKVFIESYKARNPSDTVETLDLWTLEAPDYDEPSISGRHKALFGEAGLDTEPGSLWPRVIEIFKRFNSADKYLFSLPMWNFGLPYKLKQYIDLVTQPGLSFCVTSSGYEGLVKNRPAAVIYASGGEYTEEPFKSLDFQKTPFENWLKFIGFTDIRRIVVAPTMRRDTLAETEARAAKEARELASTF